MTPYRVPSPSAHPPPTAPAHRRADALDVLVWAVVASIGLAVASGGGTMPAPTAQQGAR